MTDKLALLAERIKTAKTLYELHNALIAFEAVQPDEGPCADNTEGALNSYGIDLCELPIFGGSEPFSTCEVWSWDADYILTGIGPFTDWEIRDRPIETRSRRYSTKQKG